MKLRMTRLTLIVPVLASIVCQSVAGAHPGHEHPPESGFSMGTLTGGLTDGDALTLVGLGLLVAIVVGVASRLVVRVTRDSR